MSRSIHTTRRTVSRLAKRKFASAKEKDEALKDAKGDVFERRSDWNALLENCQRWLVSVGEDSKSRFYAYQHLAIAHCALENFQEMEKWIEAWTNFGGRKRKSEFIRKAAYRRAGRKLPK